MRLCGYGLNLFVRRLWYSFISIFVDLRKPVVSGIRRSLSASGATIQHITFDLSFNEDRSSKLIKKATMAEQTQMSNEDWSQRWTDGKTGWHKTDVHL